VDAYTLAQQAWQYIASRVDASPRAALILGSSQGDFAREVQDSVTIPYADIPGFSKSTVPGHAGELKVGTVEGTPTAVFCGRNHYYEGHPMDRVVLPVRIMHFWDIRTLVVTNAAGGLNPGFRVGDFMVLSDHLNLMADNPLMGVDSLRFGPRFPDMTRAYDPGLQQLAANVAAREGVNLRRGVYAALTGPTYETPAEVRMLATLGADAVGMSTVPETVAAVQQGANVLGISMITNMAAGISPTPLSHDEVKAAGLAAREPLFRLLKGILSAL